jgi:hypothetical protein
MKWSLQPLAFYMTAHFATKLMVLLWVAPSSGNSQSIKGRLQRMCHKYNTVEASPMVHIYELHLWGLMP